ncbi:MAG: C45 family peptidase [Rhodospirillales bacterium]
MDSIGTPPTITCIDAKGSPEEIGHMIGHAVARSFRQAVLTNPEFVAIKDHFLGTDYLQALNDAARRAYPKHMQELDGMAEAIGVDPAELFLWNCRGDLRFPPETAGVRLDQFHDGCTTILGPGDFDQGRPAVIAHNEDGSADFMAHRYWLRARPDDAPSFESYLYPGMLPGHSVAINDAGLVQTINNVRADDLKPGIPRHIICRAVLEATSIPEAIGHLRRPDRASGFHHSIGMPGQVAPLSVEAPASASVIRSADAPMAHANHLLDPYFDKLPQTVSASSAYRQQTVDAFLRTGGDTDTPEAVLFQHGGAGKQGVLRRPGDGGDDYGCTLITAVFRIHAERVEWTVHAGPDERDVLSGHVGQTH